MTKLNQCCALGRSANQKNKNEANPNPTKPIAIGVIVVSIKLPTSTAEGTDMILLNEPMIAAPSPAVSPRGCIAMELRLPNKMPIQKNAANKILTK